jgi:hypothetical protein
LVTAKDPSEDQMNLKLKPEWHPSNAQDSNQYLGPLNHDFSMRNRSAGWSTQRR